MGLHDGFLLLIIRHVGPVQAKELVGILVLSRRNLEDATILFEQIKQQQHSKGVQISPQCKDVAQSAGDSLGSVAYLHATLRNLFPEYGEGVMNQVTEYPFEGSDGNDGYYYIPFAR